VRHLVSIRLNEISPVSTPAYTQTSTALRSFARQFDADPDDVMRDAAAGELRRYFTRTDVASLPAGLVAAEHRSESNNLVENELRRKLLDERAARYGFDRPKTPQRLLMQLYRRRLEWNRPPEARSLAIQTDFPRDRYGHATDWHPAHR
jgi:hypothetical protein